MQQTVILTLLDLISLKGIFSFGYVLFVLITIGVIIHDKRDPVKALSWIVVLILLPVAGFLLYIVFGRNHRKEKLFNRKELHDLEQIDEMSREQVYAINNAALLLRSEITENRDIITLLLNSNKALLTNHNRIRVLNNGTVTFDEIKAALRGARSSIHLEYYIIEDDPLGREIAEILIGKAREGVEVRLIYDDVGSWGLSRRYIRHLRNAGVEVQCFMRVVFPWLTSKVNYRNHRKIAVIDGCVGFIGGMNIADRYVRGTEWGSWRDTHFRIEGSGAAGLQVSFLSDWSATTKRHIAGAEYYPAAERHTDDILQIVPSGPFGKWRALLQADSYAVSNARKRIWIQTPYYLPSDVLNSALQVAALAGIDVRLMLPARSDSKVVDLASHSYLDDMMKAGVKILFYKPGFLHSKLLIIDNSLTVIGSANMDFRSFEHNFEVNAFVYDREFTARMAGVFEDDASRCHALTPGEWFNRPRPRRWAESLMRVFSPLL